MNIGWENGHFQAKIRIRHLVDKNIWEMPLSKGLNLRIWFSYFVRPGAFSSIWLWKIWDRACGGISHNSRVFWRSPQEAVLHTVAGRNRRGLDWREHRDTDLRKRKRKPLESYEDLISWSRYWNEPLLMLLPRLMKERRSRNLQKKRIPHFPTL